MRLVVERPSPFAEFAATMRTICAVASEGQGRCALLSTPQGPVDELSPVHILAIHKTPIG